MSNSAWAPEDRKPLMPKIDLILASPECVHFADGPLTKYLARPQHIHVENVADFTAFREMAPEDRRDWKKNQVQLGDIIENATAEEGLPKGALGRVTGFGSGSYTADFGEFGEWRFTARRAERIHNQKKE